MATWEYEYDEVPDNNDATLQAKMLPLLDARDEDGWELVTSFHRQGGWDPSRPAVVFVFRRRASS